MTKLRWDRLPYGRRGWFADTPRDVERRGRYVVKPTEKRGELGLYFNRDLIAVSGSKTGEAFLKDMAQREANR